MPAPKAPDTPIPIDPVPSGNAVIHKEMPPPGRMRRFRLPGRIVSMFLAGVGGLIFGIFSIRNAELPEPEPAQESKPQPRIAHADHQPRDPKLQLNELVQAGNFRQAIEFASATPVIGQTPTDTRCRFQLCLCQEGLRRWRQAMDGYHGLFEDETFGIESRLAFARCAIRSGHFDEARQELGRLFAMNQLNSRVADEAVVWWAVVIDEYRDVGNLADLPVPATIELALARMDMTPQPRHHYEPAIEPLAAWMRAADIPAAHPLHDFVELRLAMLAHRAGRLNEASESYKLILAGPPSRESQAAAYNLGLIYFQAHSLKAARQAFQQVIDRGGNDQLTSLAWHQLGRAYLDEGDAKKARLPFRQVIHGNAKPDAKALAALSLAVTYLLEDDANGALLALKNHRMHVLSDPCRDFASLISTVARVKLAAGRPGEQRQRLPDVLDAVLSVSDPAIIGPAGVWLFSYGSRMVGLAGQSMPRLEDAVEQSRGPLAVRINMEIGDYHFHQRQLDAARPYYLVAAAHDQGRFAAKANRRLAEIALAAGQPGECLSYCQAAMRHPSADVAAITQLMGQAHEKAGDFANAARRYAGDAK